MSDFVPAIFLMCIGIGASVNPAAAQSEVAPSGSDEIVVSASRLPSLQADEPVALSVLGVDEAEQTAPHPAEVLNSVPGVMVQAGSGQEHLTSLRSPVLTGGAGAGSFLYLQDGVPLRSAGFANVNGLFDAHTPFADNIEVIRGPGDVAYGSNAVHGSINVLSPDPLADEPGKLHVSSNSFGHHRLTVAAGRPGVFAGLNILNDNGYRADSGVLQAKAQIGVGARRANGQAVRGRLSVHHLEQETAGFVRGVDAYRDPALNRTNPNPDAFRDSDHIQLMGEWAFDAGGWTGTLVPYGLWTDMTFRLHFLPSQAIEDSEHGAIGALLTAARPLSDKTELLAGVDVEIANGSLREEQFIPQVFSYTPGVHYDYRVGAQSFAPFIRARHKVNSRLNLQAGARVTATRYDYTNRIDDGVEGRFRRPGDRTDEFAPVTGKLGATYAVSSAHQIYGSLASGARPPQTTDLYRLQINQVEDAPDPERLNMLEVGWRHSSDGAKWAVSAFTGEKSNFLFRDADGFTVNDGKTSHAGIEGEAAFALSETLFLDASGTYARHEYEFDRDVARSSEVIRKGNDVDTAPRLTGFARLRWAPNETWQYQLSGHHVGEYYTDAANSAEYPGHTVWNVRSEWRPSSRLAIGLGVSNVFDTSYATRADFAFGSERYFPGEARAVRFDVRIAP